MEKKSSIHFLPIKKNSEQHNLRISKYDYLREDLSHLNQSIILMEIDDAQSKIREIYESNFNQKLQNSAVIIREGVANIKEDTTMDDLLLLGETLEKELGIRIIQLIIHRDEGHYIENEWITNHHAHIVAMWVDENGKTLKLKRPEMAKLQTITAEILKMERGESSDRKHLSALQFKIKAESEKLSSVKLQYEKIISGEKTIKKKGVLGYKNEDVQDLNSALVIARQNLERLQKKVQQLELEKEASQNESYNYYNEIQKLRQDLREAKFQNGELRKKSSSEITKMDKYIDKLLEDESFYLLEKQQYFRLKKEDNPDFNLGQSI